MDNLLTGDTKSIRIVDMINIPLSVKVIIPMIICMTTLKLKFVYKSIKKNFYDEQGRFSDASFFLQSRPEVIMKTTVFG